jgi:hypothetical protein
VVNAIGGMVEYKEEPLHPSVKMAKDIITRLGDYSNMSEVSVEGMRLCAT